MDSTNIHHTEFDDNFDQLDNNFEVLMTENDKNSDSEHKRRKRKKT